MTKEEIEAKLKEASKAYQSGNEIMTDSEYEALVAQLKVIDPNNILVNSDLEESEEITGFEKKKHHLITGSFKKCHNDKETKDYLRLHPSDKYVCELKIDGGGVELVYKDGKLVDAISRGNGYEGFSMLKNIKKMNGIGGVSYPAGTKLCGGDYEPLAEEGEKYVRYESGELFNGSIRCEYVMYFDTWKSKYSNMKNPRNAASGIFKRLDGKGCEDLSLIAYDMIADDGDQATLELDKINFLEDNEFIVPATHECVDVAEVIAWKDEIEKTKDSLPYPIDGIVVRPYNTDTDDSQKKIPEKSMAIKFQMDIAVTKVTDIKWQLKGSILAPVVIIEPVELNDTTVKRASAANIDVMKKLGIKIGSTIEIAKSGEIIPKIIRVI